MEFNGKFNPMQEYVNKYFFRVKLPVAPFTNMV